MNIAFTITLVLLTVIPFVAFASGKARGTEETKKNAARQGWFGLAGRVYKVTGTDYRVHDETLFSDFHLQKPAGPS